MTRTIALLKEAATDYLTWMNEHATGTRFITRFSHFYHGDSGRVRVQKIIDLIEEKKATPEEIFSKAKELYLQSGVKQHSFSRFVVDAFNQLEKDCGQS